jgi:two-component SAPR family response regulator
MSLKLARGTDPLAPLVPLAHRAGALLEKAKQAHGVGHAAALLLNRVIEFEHQLPTLHRELRHRTSAVEWHGPRLKVQALGRARVSVATHVVTGQDWQSDAARDLFFLLLAQPAGHTKEGIGDLLWPDYSPARLKLHFKNTLYRVRRALGQETVLFEDGIYRFNRQDDYEYDVDLFLTKVAEARRATSLSAKLAAYCSGIELYQGDYLPEVEGIWVLAERDRLSQTYIGALLECAELQLAQEDKEAALSYAQRAVEADPFSEQAHRLVMRVYAAMGNRTALIRQFDRCREVLRQELDASPSPETIRLFQALRD